MRYPLNVYDVYNAAANAPYGTEAHQIAEGICLMRGKHPEEWAETPWGTISNWRAVLLESRLLAELAVA